ncbi:Formylglycine-generating enzyme, required for sulfatase activity, contains SUMF1/FGE domain [Thiothrix eikelboomii]|uniref:Formylglycine-generating enzyme, required for sulfatase activity, contains SUMF1/FGE domain n=1 Tax=Thiothrix eikelboomii TaxID=92487 RepID=A0A1T4W5T7_9GAMM|nr:formylglycine-generating enzyme family protein [Thiothrix eikelboomii]SKA72499.1 Formylglycine-generating enzyme, required for sulfatase activity, contains SUMF1/FGE domain [Thiothrix eikelboomii]
MTHLSSRSKLTGLTKLLPIPAGEFMMGSANFYPEEAPIHPVYVDAFLIEEHPVTNAQFAEFVRQTDYVTVAERALDAALFPQLSAAERAPGSMVFRPTAGPVDLQHLEQWWVWMPQACWHRPSGPGSHIKNRLNHPVTQVAYEDALAYAVWAERILPSEAEWERAARGHYVSADFCWGNEKTPKGKRMAKHYQGQFPWKNEAVDGHKYSAPVKSFPPNQFGLYDMAGNVWEWTDDWYSLYSQPTADKSQATCCGTAENSIKLAESETTCCVPQNPRGGTQADSLDRSQPQFPIPRKVIKGGSFLCADEYCMRYRPGARRPQMIDSGMSHLGFRCAVRV